MPQITTEGVYCHDRRLQEGVVCSIHLFRSAHLLGIASILSKMHDFLAFSCKTTATRIRRAISMSRDKFPIPVTESILSMTVVDTHMESRSYPKVQACRIRLFLREV